MSWLDNFPCVWQLSVPFPFCGSHLSRLGYIACHFACMTAEYGGWVHLWSKPDIQMWCAQCSSFTASKTFQNLRISLNFEICSDTIVIKKKTLINGQTVHKIGTHLYSLVICNVHSASAISFHIKALSAPSEYVMMHHYWSANYNFVSFHSAQPLKS